MEVKPLDEHEEQIPDKKISWLSAIKPSGVACTSLKAHPCISEI
jgi:hypothetical protein